MKVNLTKGTLRALSTGSAMATERVAALMLAHSGYFGVLSGGANTQLLLHNGVPAVFQRADVTYAFVTVAVPPAAGESGVLDVQRSVDGGVTWTTMLSSTLTLDATSVTALTQMPLSIDPDKTLLLPGTLLRAVLTYTAGGSPAPMGSIAVHLGPGGVAQTE